jgi:putative aldouronate transport system permease protein
MGKMKGMRLGDRVFTIVNTFIMLLVIFVCLFPYWFSVVGSLNEGHDYMRSGVIFWPRKLTLDNYFVVFRDTQLTMAFQVTVLRTIIGTFCHIFVTSMFAYAYSRRYLMFRKFYVWMGLITMYFSGGMIPYYLLLRNLGLLNNFLVYIIPTAFSFWNVIIFQSFFREIPDSMIESAKIDGANEFFIFLRLILPVSLPVLAAISLFTAVGHWNAFMDSQLFTTSANLMTLQVYLSKLILSANATANLQGQATEMVARKATNVRTIQMSAMVTTSLPILFLYPFLQQYFVKGLTIGSIKG